MCNQKNILKKTITISESLAGSSFSKNISVDFTPDEVIVKTCAYYFYQVADLDNGNTIDPLRVIHSDLINMEVIATIMDGVKSHPNTCFTLNKSVNGTYKFQIREVEGELASDLVGDFVLTLEFRKYLQ